MRYWHCNLQGIPRRFIPYAGQAQDDALSRLAFHLPDPALFSGLLVDERPQSMSWPTSPEIDENTLNRWAFSPSLVCRDPEDWPAKLEAKLAGARCKTTGLALWLPVVDWPPSNGRLLERAFGLGAVWQLTRGRNDAPVSHRHRGGPSLASSDVLEPRLMMPLDVRRALCNCRCW